MSLSLIPVSISVSIHVFVSVSLFLSSICLCLHPHLHLDLHLRPPSLSLSLPLSLSSDLSARRSGLEQPVSIAVDPDEGVMFWTDVGSIPKIESAWMDGSKRRLLVGVKVGAHVTVIWPPVRFFFLLD